MPCFLVECPKCKRRMRIIQSKGQSLPACPFCADSPEMKRILTAPSAKFMERRDDEKGKSVLKNQEQILRARTRNFSRENELDDMIASNTQEVAKRQGWLTSEGKKRRKVDDT